MLYSDDNIHEALEKVAGLPGYMKKEIGKKGLRRLRTGESPIYVGGAAEKLRTSGAAHDARLRAYEQGRLTAKSIAKARKSSGQERRVHLGDAASTRGTGEYLKGQFRKLVPKDIVRREKFKVASDDNIHTALEKVAVSRHAASKAMMAIGKHPKVVAQQSQARILNRRENLKKALDPKTQKENLRVSAQQSGGSLQAGLRTLQAQPARVTAARDSLARATGVGPNPSRLKGLWNSIKRPALSPAGKARALQTRGMAKSVMPYKGPKVG